MLAERKTAIEAGRLLPATPFGEKITHSTSALDKEPEEFIAAQSAVQLDPSC